MEDIVVIDGEVELENTLDGEVELTSLHSLDPQVYLGTGGGSIVVDTAMSDTSENAVQNKVIKAYVDSQGGGGGSADPATSARYGTVKAQYSHEPSTAQLKLTFHAPTSPQETEISAISPTVQVDGSGNVTQAIYAKYLPDGTGTKKGAFLRSIWNGSISDGYDELDGEGYNAGVGGYARTVTTAEGGFTLVDGNRVVFDTGYWDGSYNHYINVDSTGYKEVMLTDNIHMGIGATGSVFNGTLEAVYNATDKKYYVVNGYALAHATGARYGTVKVSENTSSGNSHALLTYADNSALYLPSIPSASGWIGSKYLPDATSSAKGAVILKSSITAGDTNAVNSVAVIDYIASLDGSNISY